jgi:hypothetical protein
MAKRVAPLTYEAWIDYDLTGSAMSRGELEALRALLAPVEEDEAVSTRSGSDGAPAHLNRAQMEEMGLSTREIGELLEKLKPTPRPDFELDLSTMLTAETVAETMAAAVPSVDRRTDGAG